MKTRIAVATLAAAMLVSSTASAQAKRELKLSSEQRKRAQALSKEVDQVFAKDHSAPADVILSWQSAFLAAANGLVYIPYTIGIDGKFTQTPVAMYVRVLTKDAKPADYDPSKTTTIRSYTSMSVVNDPKDLRSGNIEATGVVTEDVKFFEPPRDGRLMHGMWLPPGEYNVFVGMQEKAGKELPKTAVLGVPLVVPDLSKGLAVSSVILADGIEPVPPSSKQRDQLEDPYAIAGTKILPAATTRLRKSGELMFVYYVYHPAADGGGKPNLEADYTFYSNNAGVEKLFFKSSPQMFTADTVPADFNPALHQIMGGQSVPLATFANGDYRLEVTVTDKISNATTTTNTTFSVFGQ